MQSIEIEAPGKVEIGSKNKSDGSLRGPFDKPLKNNQDQDFFLDLDHNQSLFRELLQPAPRGLMSIKAELLFLEGQLVYHWRDPQEKGGGEHFKFVSPQQATRAFEQQSVDTGWLPSGLVRWGSTTVGNWLVKFIPPTYHTVILTKLNQQHFKKLGEIKKDLVLITVPMPALIFAGSGSTYYVWAMKGQMLDPEGRLYLAPLPNLYADGKICFGSNKPPEANWDTLEATWKLFIQDAPFNADLSSGKSQKHGKDIRNQLIELSKKADGELEGPGQLSPYPVDDLVAHAGNPTLNWAIEQYLKKGSRND